VSVVGLVGFRHCAQDRAVLTEQDVTAVGRCGRGRHAQGGAVLAEPGIPCWAVDAARVGDGADLGRRRLLRFGMPVRQPNVRGTSWRMKSQFAFSRPPCVPTNFDPTPMQKPAASYCWPSVTHRRGPATQLGRSRAS
jgi:hypothetical protein